MTSTPRMPYTAFWGPMWGHCIGWVVEFCHGIFVVISVVDLTSLFKYFSHILLVMIFVYFYKLSFHLFRTLYSCESLEGNDLIDPSIFILFVVVGSVVEL